MKIQKISRNQPEFCTIPQTLHRQFMAGPVKMTVKTTTDFIALQKFQNFIAAIPFISWRIVEKNNLRQLPCRFQRCFQSQQFTFEYLLIVLPASLLLKEPSSGATNGITLIFIMVVIENELIVKTILCTEFIEFRSRAPPIIVIAFQNDLSAGNLIDPGKVWDGFFQG